MNATFVMNGTLFWIAVVGLCAAITVAVHLVRTRGLPALPLLTGRGASRGLAKVCAHLGLASDPFARDEAPAETHRCYAYMQRERIDLAHQRRFCFGSNHRRCPWLALKPANAPAERSRTVRALGGFAAGSARRVWVGAPAFAATVTGALRVGGGRALAWCGRVGGAGLALGQRAGGAAIRGGMALGKRAAVAALGAGQKGVALVWAGLRAGQTLGQRAAEGALRTGQQALLLVLAGLRRVPVRAALALAGSFVVRAGQAVAAGGALLVHVLRGLVGGGVAGARRVPLRAASEVTRFRHAWHSRPRIRVAVPLVRPSPAAPVTPFAAPVAAIPTLARASVITAPAVAPVTLCHESVHRPPEPAGVPVGAGLLGQREARESDLLERGIAALEAGHEQEAYELFKRAVTLNPNAERAWFFRARTAATLEEVVLCLERAAALDPTNQKVTMNLAWARERREHETLSVPSAPPAPAIASTSAQRHPASIVTRVNPRRTVRKENRIRPKVHGLLRALGTCAAIVLAAAWFGGTLPFDPLQTLDPSGSVRLRDTLPVIEADLSALPDAARIQVVDGYEVGEALPYTLGFLALMVALGLLNRDGWTRLWGPLLAVASGWLWLDVFSGAEQLATVLVLCTLVGFCTLVVPSSRQLSYA